jgi:hypothetical protein
MKIFLHLILPKRQMLIYQSSSFFNYISVERGLCADEEKMKLTMEVSKAMVDLSLSSEYHSQSWDNALGPKALTDLWPYDPYENIYDYY